MFEKHKPWAALRKTKAEKAAARKRGKKRVMHHAPVPAAIRALRLACGLTQVMFARQLNVAELAIIQWEGGRRVPSRICARKLYQLATMNGLDLDALGEQVARVGGMRLPG